MMFSEAKIAKLVNQNEYKMELVHIKQMATSFESFLRIFYKKKKDLSLFYNDLCIELI